ncbi:MAG: SDR family oxidoreductase [Pseudomonadales bacterium]|nr:SDR family oxidoreductase [Pseudomonadales bacterium]
MSRNIVITGANRGIGLALVKRYVENGDAVFAVCRTSSDALNSMTGITVIDGIDVVNNDDLSRLRTNLANIDIDILINNAGILTEEALGKIDYSQIERQFRVNAIGPLNTVEKLLDLLHEGAKVVLISSRMGSISDNGSGASYGYRMSKAALNAAGMSLANDLKPQGIAVGLLHPGFVKTTLVDNQGDIDTTEAARRLDQRIDELTLDTTGSFRHSNGEVLPW